MWNRPIMGSDVYHVLLWFLTYSILGWVVESIYMSICNHRLTNRGFARGPFCPIYGFGALTVYFILAPYRTNKFLLFILGAFLATTLEWATAKIMIRIFGEVWWDYSEKPFNYKGILCLESTLAWGLYTLILFGVLHRGVERIVGGIPIPVGKIVGVLIFVTAVMDFTTSFRQSRRKEEEDVVCTGEESEEVLCMQTSENDLV